MKTTLLLRARWLAFGASLATGIAALIAGCTSPPVPPPATTEPTPAPTPLVVTPQAGQSLASNATTPRAYRVDAASYLYDKYKSRIYQGMMPPLLYAIGVLQVQIDGKGRVTSLNWMRAPKHAPEVMAEIERLVRQAAPYPVPVRMGRVTYTDTWLWHKTGLFQLDTLTEGQL